MNNNIYHLISIRIVQHKSITMLNVMQNVVIEHNDLLKTCQTPPKLQSMLRNRSTAVLSVHVVDVQMKKQN